MNTDLHSSPEGLAHHTVESLGLVAMIRNWNTGGGSLISDFDDVVLAVGFDPKLSDKFDQAYVTSQTAGMEPQFEAALQLTLQKVVAETFESGLAALCGSWARTVAGSLPAKYGAPAPFEDPAAWISWCVANLETPPVVRPWGEDLFSEPDEQRLFRHALGQVTELATKSGWILSPPGPAARPESLGVA